MSRAAKRVDITAYPELLRLVEEVRESNEPRMLTRDHEIVAILMPAGPSRRRAKRRPGGKTEADYEAFLSAFGGWKDVDTDRLIEDIYARREMSIKSLLE